MAQISWSVPHAAGSGLCNAGGFTFSQVFFEVCLLQGLLWQVVYIFEFKFTKVRSIDTTVFSSLSRFSRPR